MRLTRWVLLWLLIIAVLVGIEVSVITGRLTPDPIARIPAHSQTT